MSRFLIEDQLIRPAFYQAIQKWGNVMVTATHPSIVTIRSKSAIMTEHRALLVVGKNRLDPRLFERCAAHNIQCFLEAGWSIELVDFDFKARSTNGEVTQNLPPGVIVARALAETQRLRYVVFLTHSRYAINLSEFGNDLVVEEAKNGSQYPSVPIRQLQLSESAAKEGWVDVFGCLCRPNSRWPQELAKALNWPVRTVYPGYSIYFPEETPYPRSAIPFTRGFSGSRYSKRGWAVWLPGSDHLVRVSEPGEIVRRYNDRFSQLERFFTSIISVGLEPVRDFRKRRRFAAQARR